MITLRIEIEWEDGDGSGVITVHGNNMPAELAEACAIHGLAMETGVDTDTATQQVDGRAMVLEPSYATFPFDLNYR
jgi:hypothetical protein